MGRWSSVCKEETEGERVWGCVWGGERSGGMLANCTDRRCERTYNGLRRERRTERAEERAKERL